MTLPTAIMEDLSITKEKVSAARLFDYTNQRQASQEVKCCKTLEKVSSNYWDKGKHDDTAVNVLYTNIVFCTPVNF